MTPVRSTPRDFILPRKIGSLELDNAFGDLAYSTDARAVARLDDPDAGRWVELWVDDGYRYLMVYTADKVTHPERRRAAVAIEPMTCPPDALRTGVDLIELPPGASWSGTWGLRTQE
jgi:aldose 1-epimerase